MKNVILLIVLNFFAFSSFSQQIQNAQKINVQIDGNCEMCKKTIEGAGSIPGISILTWNKTTKTASLEFDKSKTSKEAILKKVAEAGYDNEKYVAPKSAYTKLHACCQYKRTKKSVK